MRHFYLIETKYHGPTNHRGARVSAKREDGKGRRVSVPWAHEENTDQNHERAARILLDDYEGHCIVGAAHAPRGAFYVVDPMPDRVSVHTLD